MNLSALHLGQVSACKQFLVLVSRAFSFFLFPSGPGLWGGPFFDGVQRIGGNEHARALFGQGFRNV